MASKNIGYHTRLYSDNTRKIVGGSFGGAIDSETVNRLVNSQFEVVVKHSGTAVFVDRDGREVRLYLSVDADSTEKGVNALAAWRAEREKQEREHASRREQESEEIDNLMSNLSHDEIVRRLRGSS